MFVFCFKKQLEVPIFRTTIYSITQYFWVVLLYGWLPIPLLYVNKLSEEGNIAGKVKFFSILLEKRFHNDIPLVMHEITHVHQVIKTFGFHFLFYNFSSKYRYRAELEAYVNQCAFILSKGSTYDNWIAISSLVEWVVKCILKNNIYKLGKDIDREQVIRDFSMLLVERLKNLK